MKKDIFAKSGVSAKKVIKEMKFENAEEYNLADEVKVDIFRWRQSRILQEPAKAKDSKARLETRIFKRTYGSRFEIPQSGRFHGIVSYSVTCFERQKTSGTNG